jgi:hypothetical protein
MVGSCGPSAICNTMCLSALNRSWCAVLNSCTYSLVLNCVQLLPPCAPALSARYMGRSKSPITQARVYPMRCSAPCKPYAVSSNTRLPYVMNTASSLLFSAAVWRPLSALVAPSVVTSPWYSPSNGGDVLAKSCILALSNTLIAVEACSCRCDPALFGSLVPDQSLASLSGYSNP